MKLSDLQPKWIEKDDARIGVVFLCPHCVKNTSTHPAWLSCFFSPVTKMVGDDGQWALIRKAIGENEVNFVGVSPGLAWQKSGDDFGNLSTSPSIDASASGHWHGFITNGMIT